MISALTEEEIGYLRDTKKLIQGETSNLRAVQGIMVDFNKAEAKMKLGNQASNRIDGIIKIWNALEKTPEIQGEYIRKQISQKQVESLFGL